MRFIFALDEDYTQINSSFQTRAALCYTNHATYDRFAIKKTSANSVDYRKAIH